MIMKKFIIIIVATMGFSCVLQSQTLDDYFKIAAENNPGLQAKFKEFEASMEKSAQVSGLPDPSLSFGFFISPVETRVGPQRAKFSLTQMFPWFGTLKAQGNVTSLLSEAKYQAFLDARNKLYFEVSAAYYSLYELQELISIEEENREILTSYKDIATVKFQNGKGTMVDVLRVDITLQDVITNLSILGQKQKPLDSRFNKLLNRPENEAIIVEDSLSIPRLPDDYRRDSLLTSNPLITELELKTEASKASEKAATKQSLPKVGVGVDYVMVGQRTDMVVADNGKDVLMPMVSVSLPIFRGKYKAAQKEAQLMQESYTFQKEDISNRLTSSYDMIWFESQKQAEFIQLYESQIKTSKQSLYLLYTSYSNSGKEFEEVLRMQQQILKYQKLKVTALSEFHIRIAELDYITAKSK